MGTKVGGGVAPPPSGARPEEEVESALRFFFVVVEAVAEKVETAGMVPVPVAAMMEGSACSSNHRMVSPSVLWPSSRVSWNIRAAQVGGMRILRPRPSTFVWRSFVEAARFGIDTGMGVAAGDIVCGG